MAELRRTHTCGELRKSHVGQEVVLCGWVVTARDHGGVVFADVRDRYGLTQVVFNPERCPEEHKLAHSLRQEFVIAVRGEVRARPDDMVNPKLDTGEIEVYADELVILNKADTPPFEVADDAKVGLDLRLKHRYLDLRRPVMQKRLVFRSRVAQAIRAFYSGRDFVEVETPMLTKSTPEGARDYLVPSRVNQGRFYALPQSPQLFKQILMIAGLDRYFQIVRCFRDEDLRADRQPEFTQLDVEMAFVTEEDVFECTEQMLAHVFKQTLDRDIPTPFPRLTYAQAMAEYGTDKPDTRFEMKLADVTDLAAQSEFKVFRSVADAGGMVKGLAAPGGAQLSRKDIDGLTEFVGEYGAKGLAWFKVEGGKLTSSIAKFFSEDLQAKILERVGGEDGSLLLFVADQPSVVNQSLAELRRHLARRLGLIPEDRLNFLWVYDFPLVEWDEEEERYVALHHPFTSPRPEDLDKLESDTANVRARAYDVVLNGAELGGGSIRIHRPDVQTRVFKLLGIDEAEAQEKFGFLLDALRYGAPPHGGIALGFDRMTALMLGLDNIREVIAFPKTQKATCLMTGAPSPVSEKQLRELAIRSLAEE